MVGVPLYFVGASAGKKSDVVRILLKNGLLQYNLLEFAKTQKRLNSLHIEIGEMIRFD